MASHSNVPKDVLDSIRVCVDRQIKLSIKRLVNMETKKDRSEQRVLAFSPYRMFVFTAKVPTKVETNMHYLDIRSIESKRPNHFVVTTAKASFTFHAMEADTDEVNHMITHIGTSLKTIFPAFNIERLIKKVEVQPPERLRVMHDMTRAIEQREMGPCGGFTGMYACMCDFHGLTYRDEVAWDVDTIYLSQDSRELCLRDFDHLKERDLVPIVSALVHNTWFTTLNANNVKLAPEVCNEILRVMRKNSVIESLLMSNTGIGSDFVKKLSTVCMSEFQLLRLDLSNNAIDDTGAEHIFGALSSRGKMFTFIDLSRTKVTSRGLNRVSESMSRSPQVFSSLQTLKLAGLNSQKPEDLQGLYTFLASPNMLSHLDLSGTDVELEKIVAPLQRGCSQNITVLKLSRTVFTHKRMREVVVPATFKQFFASVVTLKQLDLSGCKIPPEALKELLLGIGCNRNVNNLQLNVSGVDLQGSQGASVLQSCLPNIGNISSLNISGIVFGDQDLTNVLNSIGQNKAIKHLYMGRIFQNIKPKNMRLVMEELVHVIQDEDSVIETLSLADSKLKDSMNMIINALGSNMSLIELDISGNMMGDLGARMLSKALQINNKLKTIIWDKNNTSCVGFEDIADALNKTNGGEIPANFYGITIGYRSTFIRNYTLRKMPIPVYDASVALRNQPDRTEQALQTIESLLQRNHSPQKYSSDQAYRLQQGFLISSTQQMVDRLVVQSQDTIHALTIDDGESYTNDVELARSIIKDADNSKTLLPNLHDIAIQSQNAGNPVGVKLKEIASELKTVLESQMKNNVAKMIQATERQCKALMKDHAFVSDLKSGCTGKSAFPKDFTSNILTGVDTDIFNTLSEMNLAVAAHVSDRVIDEVIERLSSSHKTLTNHLNQKKKDVMRRSQNRSSKSETNQANMQTKASPKQEKDFLKIPSAKMQDSPQMQNKRQSMHQRKIRPQSVIDREILQVALDADRQRPVTVPQGRRSPKLGSRSPHTSGSDTSRSPKPERSHEARALKPPRRRKVESGSPGHSDSASDRSRSPKPIPAIEVTSADRSGHKEEPVYDNVIFEKNYHKPGRPRRRREKKSKDGLENDPDLPQPSPARTPPKSEPEIDSFDVVPELTQIKPLTTVTKDRPRRAKQVRPTTRASAAPTTLTVSNGTDDDVESFFTTSSSTLASTTPAKGDKSGSNKSTPESSKKLAGNKETDKDNKEKKKAGGVFGGLFGGKKQTPSPAAAKKSPRVVSDIQEEPESDALRRSVTDNTSLRGSQDKKRDDVSNNSPLREASVKKESDKEDSESIKSTKSSDSVRSLSKKSDDSGSSLGKKSDDSGSSLGKKSDDSGSSQDKKSDDGNNGAVEKKKPLGLPKKASLREQKTVEDEVKADTEDLKETHSTEEKEAEVEKKEEKAVKTEKVEESKETEKEPDSKPAEDDAGEAKTKEDDDAATTKIVEEASPELGEAEAPKPVKKPGPPGGMGFGMNVNFMAEIKAKQEKRQSMLIGKPVDKPAEKPKPTEENEPAKSPFGLKNLKPVGSKTASPKESPETQSKSASVPLKPADNIASEAGKGLSPGLVKKPVSGDTVVKKSSLKENGVDSSANKPAVVPRPALSKPPPPARPKPPPPSSKPTPAPRRSIASESEQDDTSVDTKPAPSEESKTSNSEIVYDSATLKMSVKDKISKFGRSSGGSPKVERPKSKAEDTEADKKRSSLSKDLRKSDTNKPSSARSSRKSDDVEACDLDLRTEENPEMTDSGIVQDAEKPAVKGKAGSLPRTAKPSDMERDAPADTPKRPHSMMAVLGNHPSLMQRHDAVSKTATIPESQDSSNTDSKTEDKKSSAEDVILV